MLIRTRFAPSPTGYLHVGGLRTALYNYIYAKKNQGVFILRIEDTDQSRLVNNATEQLIKSIEKFDLNFDEGPNLNEHYGPYKQSERLDIYRKYYLELIKNKKAYVCEVNEDNLIPEFDPIIALNLIKKEEFVVKLKIPKDRIMSTYDQIRGKVDFDLNLIEDPIIIKSDGYPTYHFANVVDDYLMKITHVIRGEEWLPSLPKHILLYEYFGWNLPKFVHLPLLLNEDKSKLSKRQGDVNVDDFLDKGYIKEAIINFIALLGWHPSNDNELFSMNSLLKNFSLKKIQKSGAIFDRKKLDWMNSIYIKKLDVDAFIVLSKEFYYHLDYSFTNKRKLINVFKFIQNRISRFDEIPDLLYPFYNDVVVKDENLLLIMDQDTSKQTLKYWIEILSKNENFDQNFISDLIKKTGIKFNIKGKEIFHPIRIALWGQPNGPDLFTLVKILGLDETLKRFLKFI